MKIFGHEFSDIQRAQQGGRLAKSIDVSAPLDINLTDDDMALLRTHGSIQALEEAGFHGTADRLRRAGVANDLGDDQTDNTAFEQWFAGSKVVDADGKPLRVYHGTDKQFSQFALEHLGSNTAFDNTKLGFFFIADRTLAENFARDTSGGTRIIEAYLCIKKPLDLTTQGIFNNVDQAATLCEIFSGERLAPDEALASINEEIGIGEFLEITEAISTPEAKAIMVRDGFDGAISHFGAGNLEYIAFDPEVAAEIQTVR